MRKGWLVLLSVALVVALAVPASAEFKLNGFYRVRPTMSNFQGAGNSSFNLPGAPSSGVSLSKDSTEGTADTNTTRAFTEMRNRLRFEIGDENVKGVTFLEIDGNFGDIGGRVGRNQGFAQNGDSINIETKNVFLWFKIPDTTLTFTVGLQGYTDEFAGLLFGASDQAGVVVNYKYEPVTFRLTWFKLRDSIAEGDAASTTISPTGSTTSFFQMWKGNNPGDRDADYYAVDAKFAPAKDVAATLHFGYIRDSGGENGIIDPGNTLNTFAAQPTEASGYDYLQSYYAGANATFKVAPATLSAFFLYNFGKFKHADPGDPDIKIKGYAARLRGDLALGPGNAFLEGLYVSGDDNPTDDKYKSIVTGSDYAALTSYYGAPDLLILFPNLDMINSACALVLNPNNSGRGLMLLAGGYSQKFTDKVTGKLGLGYLAADKKRPSSPTATDAAKGKGMATEVNANVNYNISKGLDFGLYGAYAFLGKYYDRTSPDKNPDDLYTLYGRLNYAF